MAREFFEQIETEASDTVGLLEAQRLVAQGQGQYMAVLYAKGAAFWRELDEGIQGASAGTVELDDFLPELFAEPFSQTGVLPISFSEAIGKRIPNFDFDSVVAKFF